MSLTKSGQIFKLLFQENGHFRVKKTKRKFFCLSENVSLFGILYLVLHVLHYNRDEISTQSVIPKEFEYFLIQNKYIKAYHIENVNVLV